MQISTTLKLLSSQLSSQQGYNIPLTVFTGQTKVAPYVGILRERNLLALGLVGPNFSEASVRQDLCSRPAWRQAAFQEAKINIAEIEALELWGTPFQIKVWETLYNLSRNQTVTYKEVAYQAGYPTAFQAIGQAISRNPISLLIPCHLVVKKSGEIGDYYWGRSLKGQLLQQPSLEEFL